MKKLVAVVGIGLLTIMAGCSKSGDITISVDNMEDFANVAEQFEQDITDFEDYLKNLEDQSKLSKKDQKELASDIEDIRTKIDEFSEIDPPFAIEKAQNLIKDEFDKKEELLVNLQEKAENGKATVKEIKEFNDEFFSDISFNLFNW